MIRNLPIIPFLLLFGGCSEEKQKPYIIGQKPKTFKTKDSGPSHETNNAVAIAAIEAKSKKDVAQIRMHHDLELQKIKQKTKMYEVATDKEIAFSKQEMLGKKEENAFALNKSILIVSSLFITAILVIIAYFLRKRREDKLKMHRDRMENELLIKEKELQVKMAEKILDTIASGTLGKEDERKLIETFEKTNRGIPHKKQP